MSQFYRLRRGKVISGVIAGLSDKFGWDLALSRILAFLFILFSHGVGLLLYVLCAIFLPYEDETQMYGEKDTYQYRSYTGPRRRKDVTPIIDED